jgi:hypothetical protein
MLAVADVVAVVGETDRLEGDERPEHGVHPGSAPRPCGRADVTTIVFVVRLLVVV